MALEIRPETGQAGNDLRLGRVLCLRFLLQRVLRDIDMDRARPTVVYCFDTQCDLSGRAAARLEQLGFAEVYD